MFEKLVGIEPLRLPPYWEEELKKHTHSLTLYRDRPTNNEEIIKRIGDADGVLVSHVTPIDREVLAACKNIKYIGMCCSLYSPESANVDILTANSMGIVVLGVRDYGDEGVAEYVVSELVRLLHGFGEQKWSEYPTELTGLNIGVLGMGTTGQIVSKSLRFFGANIYYYSRTRKHDLEAAEQYVYLPLHELLGKVDILCTCLTRNTVLLYEKEFELYGNGKILMNISIAPSYDVAAAAAWLNSDPKNFLLGDTNISIDYDGSLLTHPQVICVHQSGGMTSRARERLGEKVIQNIQAFFKTQA